MFTGDSLSFTSSSDINITSKFTYDRKISIFNDLKEQCKDGCKIKNVFFVKPRLVAIVEAQNVGHVAVYSEHEDGFKLDTILQLDLKSQGVNYQMFIIKYAEIVSHLKLLVIEAKFCNTQCIGRVYKITIDGDPKIFSIIEFNKPEVYDKEFPIIQLIQRSISSLSNYLYRVCQQSAKSRDIEVFSIDLRIPESIFVNEFTLKINSEEIMRKVDIFMSDFFFCFTKRIYRARYNHGAKKIDKQHTVDLAQASLSFYLKAISHLDVYVISNSKQASIIRWDEIDTPYLLNSLRLDSEIAQIGGSYYMMGFLSTDKIMIKRNDDSFLYAIIDYDQSKIDPGAFKFAFNLQNFIIMMEGDSIKILQIARSVFLKIWTGDSQKISVTATTYYGVSQSAIFDINVIPADTGMYLKVKNTELAAYLSGSLSSKSVYRQSIPQDWFEGDLLNLNVSCEVDNLKPSIILSEKFYPKKSNLELSNFTSENVFYYKFDYNPQDDGSYILLFQVNLEIYMKKCYVSLENLLKCKVIYKEKNSSKMIIEAKVIGTKYLIYKTEDGFTALIFDEKNFLTPKRQSFLNQWSTCDYKSMMMSDYLFCSDFKNRNLVVYKLSDTFEQIITVTSIYALQIEISDRFPDLAFTMGDMEISVISYQTGASINNLTSDIISQSDAKFIICGRRLIVQSIILNSFEIYDIINPEDIVRVKPPTSFNMLNLKLQENTHLGGCMDSLPFIVNDGKVVKAALLSLEDVVDSSFRDIIELGKMSYYSNYFIYGLHKQGSNSLLNKIIWSFLQTSSQSLGIIGDEYELFSNYRMIIDFTEQEFVEKNKLFNCSLNITSHDKTLSEIIQFSVSVDKTSLVNTVEKSKTKDYIDPRSMTLFNQYSIIDLDKEFSGSPLVYNVMMNDEDYNKYINEFPIVSNYWNISKILISSRPETVIKDVYISESGSIYALTDTAIYKLKKGTTYFVSQFLYTNLQSSDTIICHKIQVYSDRNLMWGLCDKSNIPYAVLSNWNSMTPSFIFLQQLNMIDISLVKFFEVDDMNLYIFGYLIEGVADSYTMFVYELGLTNQQNKNIVLNEISKLPVGIAPKLIQGVYWKNTKIFLMIQGTANTILNTNILIKKLDEKKQQLLTLMNTDITRILDSDQLSAFTAVVDFKCKPTNDTKITCILLMEENLHYELLISGIDNTSGFPALSITVERVYAGYGMFRAIGVDFDNTHLAIFITEAEMDVGEWNFTSGLAQSYITLYNRKNEVSNSSESSNSLSLKEKPSFVGSVPVISRNVSNVNLNLELFMGERFLLFSSQTYYSLLAFQLNSSQLLNVSKSAMTKNLTLQGINHYSVSTLIIQLEEKTLFYILAAIGVLGLISAFGLIAVIWRRSRENRSLVQQSKQFNDISVLTVLRESNPDIPSSVSTYEYHIEDIAVDTEGDDILED